MAKSPHPNTPLTEHLAYLLAQANREINRQLETRLNHPTLTKMIDRMVSDSLVYRRQDAHDRRKVLMFISDRGKALCKRLNSLAASQEAHILENYGDKATGELKRLLENLIDAAS